MTLTGSHQVLKDVRNIRWESSQEVSLLDKKIINGKLIQKILSDDQKKIEDKAGPYFNCDTQESKIK